jgi:hypothetical protein
LLLSLYCQIVDTSNPLYSVSVSIVTGFTLTLPLFMWNVCLHKDEVRNSGISERT